MSCWSEDQQARDKIWVISQGFFYLLQLLQSLEGYAVEDLNGKQRQEFKKL